MGAGGSSERRASVGVVGVSSSGEGAPVFQQRQVADARGCSIDTRNSRDFTDISNSEAGGIISPQFITSYGKKTNSSFSFKAGSNSMQTVRAPPTSSCSSPSLPHSHRPSSGTSSDTDSNKENTTPDTLSGNAKSKILPGTTASQNGITRVQPKVSTPPNQVSDNTLEPQSTTSRNLSSNHHLDSISMRPVMGSPSSSFESRTISEGIHRKPQQRVAPENSSSGKTSEDGETSRSRSPTSSPNSGDLKIEEVA